MSRYTQRITVSIILIILAFRLFSPGNNVESAHRVHAATIVVNTTLDDPIGCPESCTLRSAIDTATTGDVIQFTKETVGTIELAEVLNITKDLTISGPGESLLAIDGKGESQVFNITGTVSISGLTIQNGSANTGGGILNSGNLNLSHTNFSNNVALNEGGAIFNTGTLNIVDSNFSKNSSKDAVGAISNVKGTLNIARSVFDGNSSMSGGDAIGSNETLSVSDSKFTHNGNYEQFATVVASGKTDVLDSSFSENKGLGMANNGEMRVIRSNFTENQGGGVWNHGTMTIDASTFSNNRSIAFGGGIGNQGTLDITSSTVNNNSAFSGGGGLANAGILNLTNCTIYGNLVIGDGTGAGIGGGIMNSGSGTLIVMSSTIYGNSVHPISGDGGGGIYNTHDDQTTLGSTIVAGNTAGRGSPDITGKIKSKSYNLIGNTQGTSGFFSSDQQNVDPMLSPLELNAPGKTMTMALQPASSAIGKGGPKCPTTDQRGVTRKKPCDIGAYETEINQAAATSPANTEESTEISPTHTTALINTNVSTVTFNGSNTLGTVTSPNVAVSSVTSTPSTAQNNICQGGLPSRLFVGSIAVVITVPSGNKPINLYSSPDRSGTVLCNASRPIYDISVVEGPQCSDDGTTWWKVQYTKKGTFCNGWMPESGPDYDNDNGELNYFLTLK